MFLNNIDINLIKAWISTLIFIGLGTIALPATAQTTTSLETNNLKVTTPYGFVQLGPQNSSWSHISTNMDKFYFNKTVHINGSLHSYSGKFSMGVAGNEYFTIGGYGKVGIGYTSPSYQLDVRSFDTEIASFRQSASSGADAGIEITGARNGSISADVAYVDFRNYDNDEGAGVNYRMARISGGMNDVSGQTGYLNFKTNNGGGLVEAIRINKDGNMGVGTTSPDYPLDIMGSGDGSSIDGVYYYGVAGFRNNAGGGILVSVDDNKNPILHSTYTGTDLIFGTRTGSSNFERMRILDSGNVGIGTTTPDEKLTVNGTIHTSEVRVDLSVPAPDYVFGPSYQLRSLNETEEYIKANSHLPEIPSGKEMEANGVELGEMNMLLLKKIEELTLYILDIEKRVKEIEK